MPYKPARHQPQGADAAIRARLERDRQRYAERPSPEARGYDADWRILRATHLAAHPACAVDGCTRPATDVDHVESIEDNPDRRLDPTNLRSFCHQHHAQRTARDQGFARPSGSLNETRGSPHPDWLKGPSRVPITVVCGPPGAGKGSYVRERMGARDLVLELDDIAATLSGQPKYAATAAYLGPALRWRNAHLRLCCVRRAWDAAWLVIGEPKAEWRTWWRQRLRPTRIVVMETETVDCITNIRADTTRPDPVKRAHEDAAIAWWAAYSRLDDDVILRPHHRPTTGRGLARW